MNPAIINLAAFTALVLIIWLVSKLVATRNVFTGKSRQQKTLTEDILKQLYHVEQSKRTATITDLSGALQVKRSKILPIVEATTASGLLHSTNEALYLTDTGREYALKIVRVHRLWEKYLAEKTGYQPSEWHFLAEKMEHKLEDEDIKKLSSSLGNPMFDPHGDPIPSAQGEISEVKWLPLPSYPTNKPGKIVHIEDEPDVIYQQILAKRIFVGSHILVQKSTASEVVISCEGQQHSFSPIVAANINIEELSAEESYEQDAQRLSTLESGEMAKVLGISQECRGANRRRLLDLGILPGTAIEVDLKSPLRDPIAYRVKNTSIALRNSLADLILINKTGGDDNS
jgi:DtxR family transcriptional regulator, Mn-dependent transcriptional regulator